MKSDYKDLMADFANTVAEKAAAHAVQQVLAKYPVQPRYLTPKQASVYMGFSVDGLYAWRMQVQGPAFHRIHRSVRYDTHTIDAWMAGSVPGLDGVYVSYLSHDCDEPMRKL